MTPRSLIPDMAGGFRRRHAFCPNCGKRYLDIPDDFLNNDPGCGDCAQAGVRPRERYRLRELQEWTRETDTQIGEVCKRCKCPVAPGTEHSMFNGNQMFACEVREVDPA